MRASEAGVLALLAALAGATAFGEDHGTAKLVGGWGLVLVLGAHVVEFVAIFLVLKKLKCKCGRTMHTVTLPELALHSRTLSWPWTLAP